MSITYITLKLHLCVTKLLGKTENFSINSFYDKVLSDKSEIGFKLIWLLGVKLWVLFWYINLDNFQILYKPLQLSPLSFAFLKLNQDQTFLHGENIYISYEDKSSENLNH